MTDEKPTFTIDPRARGADDPSEVPICFACNDPIFGGKEHTYDHAKWHPDCLATHLQKQHQGEGSELVRGRDERYGRPRPRHMLVVELFTQWQTLWNHEIHEVDPALQHAVYMILDKLTRIAVSPIDEEHWLDIKGYAECALESVEELSGEAADAL